MHLSLVVSPVVFESNPLFNVYQLCLYAYMAWPIRYEVIEKPGLTGSQAPHAAFLAAPPYCSPLAHALWAKYVKGLVSESSVGVACRHPPHFW